MSFITNAIVLSVIFVMSVTIAIVSVAKEKADDDKLWKEFGFTEPVDPVVVCFARIENTTIIVAKGKRSKAEPQLAQFMRNNKAATNPRIRFARS